MAAPGQVANDAHTCPNCATEVSHDYCGGCGQGRHEHSRSLMEIGREILDHGLLLEGRTARTLAALVGRPGFLTKAYIDGRRVAFLSPIRIYLFATLGFFIALSLSDLALIQFRYGPQDDARVDGGPQSIAINGARVILPRTPDGRQQAVSIKFLAPATPPPAGATMPAVDLDADAPPVARLLIAGLKTVFANPRALNAVLEVWLPRLFVLLLPLAALGLTVVNRRRGLYFVDHLAFALHGQSFAFLLGVLVLAIAHFWPEPPLFWPVALVLFLYTVLAWRRVYAGSWLGILVKVVVLGGLFAVTLMAGLLAVLVIGIEGLAG